MSIILAKQEAEVGRSQFESSPGQKYRSLSEKQSKSKRARDVAQVIESLPSKLKALGSMLVPQRNKSTCGMHTGLSVNPCCAVQWLCDRGQVTEPICVFKQGSVCVLRPQAHSDSTRYCSGLWGESDGKETSNVTATDGTSIVGRDSGIV
jgi:hypothetical protein